MLTRTLPLALVVVGTLATTPAWATLITLNDSQSPLEVTYSLNTPVLTATLEFSNYQVSNNIFSTEVTIKNTSSTTINDRLTAFGFDIDPNATVTSSSSIFKVTQYDTFPGFQKIDVCLYEGKNCSGGAGGGLTDGQSDKFTLDFVFSGLAPNNIDLSDFAVKFQSSADSYEFPGKVTEAPEPISLALIGSGLIGIGMVRRRTRGTAVPMTADAGAAVPPCCV